MSKLRRGPNDSRSYATAIDGHVTERAFRAHLPLTPVAFGCIRSRQTTAKRGSSERDLAAKNSGQTEYAGDEHDERARFGRLRS